MKKSKELLYKLGRSNRPISNSLRKNQKSLIKKYAKFEELSPRWKRFFVEIPKPLWIYSEREKPCYSGNNNLFCLKRYFPKLSPLTLIFALNNINFKSQSYVVSLFIHVFTNVFRHMQKRSLLKAFLEISLNDVLLQAPESNKVPINWKSNKSCQEEFINSTSIFRFN